MKYLVLLLITIYQQFFSVILRNVLGIKSSCRFYPTCSQYAQLSIEREGVFKGSFLSFKRLISCQPFYKEYNDKSISV